MAIRIVRLGSARAQDEGIRIGTVRRPPRGARKDEYAKKYSRPVVSEPDNFGDSLLNP